MFSRFKNTSVTDDPKSNLEKRTLHTGALGLWAQWRLPHRLENKQHPESSQGPLLPQAVTLLGRISVWL